mgnify:CR=1 FL=1
MVFALQPRWMRQGFLESLKKDWGCSSTQHFHQRGRADKDRQCIFVAVREDKFRKDSIRKCTYIHFPGVDESAREGELLEQDQ